jgi:hypothetical protein
LPAFVHLMRNYGVDLVMVGTTSGVADADAAVNKAATLADALVTCRFVDVFGKSQVVLSGDQAGGHDGTTVLPVIRRAATKNSMPCLELDRSYLEGIVGLETANPHRPGLVLQVFEDEPPHARYNREMEAMLRAALARPRRRSLERKSASEAGASEASDASVQRLDVELSEASDVSMQPFGADLSEAIHDSLDILLNRPVNRTVLCTVDEFSSDSEEAARLFVPIKTGESGLGNLNPSALIYPPAGSVHAWPYYCNVLLIAYKQSWFDSQKATSTKNGFWSPRTWQEVWQAASGPQTFWYDQTARETLACMLMDALVAAQKWELPADGRERERMLNDLLRPSPPRDLRAEETKELVALGRLMSLAWDNARASGSGRPPSEGRPHLSKDASVFVCWYSQLRELIAREPSLAGDFRVCALPGGGFRGDWFIGILRGSVSPELGQEVIEKLCRLGEEYKRFTRGVGLPVSASFLDRGCDYFAWPLAVQPPFEKATVPLTRVFDIHERAWLRSYITDYKTIRSTLSTAALQFSEMGQIGSMDDEVVESFVREVVGTRMFRQLRMLIS